MVDFGLEITKNKIITKKDMQNAVLTLIKPLEKYYTEGKAYLKLDNTSAHYYDSAAHFEGFSRPLWGLVPLLAGGGSAPQLEAYLTGIKNGTNPNHPEYWGEYDCARQEVVDMAAIGLFMALRPDLFHENFTKEELGNLGNWIRQPEEIEIHGSNWIYFRVMVQMGLYKVGLDFSREKMLATLDEAETLYRGDGWFAENDYYTPFGYHFYSLIFSKIMADEYPERAKLFRERATEFAKQFIYWSDASGGMLPYGRSLTYKFAQSSFWSILAFAEVEGFDWGVVKGIIMRNLRWWLSKPIFSRDGILTVGYTYPNFIMSEEYNAPGSPYWSFKVFLVLALPDNHSFWTCEEKPLPKLEPNFTMKEMRMIMQNIEDDNHTVALTAGLGNWHSYGNDKYNRFAYSTKFGFSVSRSNFSPYDGAYENFLALTELDNENYRVKTKSEVVEITDKKIVFKWKPWSDVEIETTLIAKNPWHIRIHKIKSGRPLKTVEGGFAISRDTYHGEMVKLEMKNGIAGKYPWGLSGIVDLAGNRNASIEVAMANTNIMSGRTIIPTIKGEIPIGETTLCCAVFAGEKLEFCENAWNNPPKI